MNPFQSPVRKWRKRLFALAAVVVVLTPFVIVELILRFWLSTHPIQLDDPYISFKGLKPLFVRDATGTCYETAKERLAFFRRQTFRVDKSPNAFRIFCLGGSTVQGRPYAVETSFTTWLKLNLESANPSVNFEVVNCGGISYASYRLIPIMREALKYEPDLFVLYTGHNEFLEDRTYRHLKRIPRWMMQMHRTMLHLRIYSAAFQSVYDWRLHRNDDADKTVLPGEVWTKLDFRNGLESYRRDDRWRERIVEHFQINLDALIQTAQHAGVPVILVNPVSNLKDCPPFKSEFSTGLSDAQKDRIYELWDEAESLDWNDALGKLQLLDEAVKVDGRHAGLLYMQGKCYQELGRFPEAKQWFVKAKEEDICPLRILEPMHEAILEAADEYQLPLVDVKAAVEYHTEDGVPGDEWLLDHVHPSIAGHQLIADALFMKMAAMNLIPALPDWRESRNVLWKKHLSNLNEAYYAQGAMQLERLQQWSRGRIPESMARRLE